MATGWAGDGAVQDQIDSTVDDAVKRARSRPTAGAGVLRTLLLLPRRTPTGSSGTRTSAPG